ncbi:MAG: methionine synthase [Candidatus Marinimicrobia bacterium]|nr:methionine synthase [Candidatus Neomarinimicrobiota bacterium]MBT3683129.1 methionine synthase [Candidatus Neomarinimicrobiota bacterium]MBT3896809.1 methionine synthase [Candidatus Neomarinimicrobiota bacterium]MBT6217681.1 methionine synthase [Candidatus Neomarinimicrobiota bacterium]MBT6713296.1 methionine synthase [Candidatus Neomarinimicrobiota bacterium]
MDFHQQLLKPGNVLVADGAMGTMLFKAGLKSGECPELLNLEKPEIPADVARQYFNAGSHIIFTNTFGASPVKLADFGLADKAVEINSEAVRIVRKVVGDKAFIAGSCGPSGKMLQPYGESKPDELFSSFKIQAEALINAGADIICIETMSDIQEALLALKATRSISASFPVMVTLTYDKTARGFYTYMGIDIDSTIKKLENEGVDVIGSNCGNGFENMVEIAKQFKKLTSIPLLIQANAGQPRLTVDELVYDETPDYFAENARKLIDLGVSIIGGCCGTTPAHISAIRQVIDTYQLTGKT